MSRAPGGGSPQPRTPAGIHPGPGALVKATRLLSFGGATAAAGLMACGTWTAVAWARYGHPAPNATRWTTLWTSSFPHPEVDEYHQLEVDAPAPITFAVAKGMDLRAKPIVKGIFWLRAVPTMLRGQPSRPPGPRGVVEDHLLPPEEFATFAEPGSVKIVNTLAAEQLGTGRSWFVTHTRVVTTDAEARRRFRRDWAPMSAEILLIRYASLPMVKPEAERRARNQHRRSDDLPDPDLSASVPARGVCSP